MSASASARTSTGLSVTAARRPSSAVGWVWTRSMDTAALAARVAMHPTVSRASNWGKPRTIRARRHVAAPLRRDKLAVQHPFGGGPGGWQRPVRVCRSRPWRRRPDERHPARRPRRGDRQAAGARRGRGRCGRCRGRQGATGRQLDRAPRERGQALRGLRRPQRGAGGRRAHLHSLRRRGLDDLGGRDGHREARRARGWEVRGLAAGELRGAQMPEPRTDRRAGRSRRTDRDDQLRQPPRGGDGASAGHLAPTRDHPEGPAGR